MSPHAHIEIEHAVPELEPGIRFRKWATLLVGVAAATASVLALAENESNRQKEHGFVDSARYAEQIFVQLGASAQPAQFEGNAARLAITVGQEGAARALSAKRGQPLVFAFAVAAADQRASKRLVEVAKQLATVPKSAPGLDPRTGAAVRASLPETMAVLDKQRAAADDADLWATRQEHTIFALGLVAIAAALGGLAGLMGVGRPGRIAATTGSIALAVAIVWSGVTFLG